MSCSIYHYIDMHKELMMTRVIIRFTFRLFIFLDVRESTKFCLLKIDYKLGLSQKTITMTMIFRVGNSLFENSV